MKSVLNTNMRDDRTPGAQTEADILAWIQDLGLIGVSRPYIWPGSWPARDMSDMAQSLPGWIYDSAWIWYEAWDPEIPGAVEAFNVSQGDYHARTIHREGAWHPPRDIIMVTPRHDADIVTMSMWLGLGETHRRNQ